MEKSKISGYCKDIILPFYQRLWLEWNKSNRNLDRCQRLLKELEVKLINISFLPTSLPNTFNKQEMLITRDTLEIGAKLSIAKGDSSGFERYMAQLKCYYYDYQKDLPVSTDKHHLLGLNLLYLLSQNRMAEFHMEIELLPVNELQNVYIQYPISLEQYLIEGSYNQIFRSKKKVPAADYDFFMNILLHTVRNEIASCIEKAYEQLAFVDTKRMLFFESSSALKNYADEREWKMDKNGNFVFNSDVKYLDTTFPASELTSEIMQYAKELEKIV